MSVTPNKAIPISQYELLHRVSEKTGFTQKNCKTAYDAFVEVFAEVVEEGRSIVFRKFGRIEPCKKPPRKYYKIDPNEGIAKDEMGKPITFIMPEVNTVKFYMSPHYKYKINPGTYSQEGICTDDSD